MVSQIYCTLKEVGHRSGNELAFLEYESLLTQTNLQIIDSSHIQKNLEDVYLLFGEGKFLFWSSIAGSLGQQGQPAGYLKKRTFTK